MSTERAEAPPPATMRSTARWIAAGSFYAFSDHVPEMISYDRVGNLAGLVQHRGCLEDSFKSTIFLGAHFAHDAA